MRYAILIIALIAAPAIASDPPYVLPHPGTIELPQKNYSYASKMYALEQQENAIQGLLTHLKGIDTLLNAVECQWIGLVPSKRVQKIIETIEGASMHPVYASRMPQISHELLPLLTQTMRGEDIQAHCLTSLQKKVFAPATAQPVASDLRVSYVLAGVKTEVEKERQFLYQELIDVTEKRLELLKQKITSPSSP